MPPVGLEPTISEAERPQTYALDRAATGTCKRENRIPKKCIVYEFGSKKAEKETKK